MNTVYISIGSNIGDKLENCFKSIDLLNKYEAVEVVEKSFFYQTQPVDYLDQDWFVNGVLKISTTLSPEELLEVLHCVEKKSGRKKNGVVRFGPRIIDLDIIFFEDIVYETDDLIIPHPRMHNRCFVLKPICDMIPEFIHPVKKIKMVDLLKNIDSSDQEVNIMQ